MKHYVQRSCKAVAAVGGAMILLASTPGKAEADVTKMSDIELARLYRPDFYLDSGQVSFPLTFREIPPHATDQERIKLRDRRSSSYNPEFAVLASVKRSPWSRATFRITYGVAFGWQQGNLSDEEAYIYEKIFKGDTGRHGEDAQYVVVDVVNGNLTSFWADLHKGWYSRTLGSVENRGTHVKTFVGRYFNSIKLVPDTASVCDDLQPWRSDVSAACTLCSGSCFIDPAINWGDPVGRDIIAEGLDHTPGRSGGRIVMVEDVCATAAGASYTSPAPMTYSGQQVDALKDYIGCANAKNAWKSALRTKDAYKDPYMLSGCKEGDASGGSICFGSEFGTGLWLTSWQDVFVSPHTVGEADVDYKAGDIFNDFRGGPEYRLKTLTLRGGKRVDQVSSAIENTRWNFVDHLTHGGDGGSWKQLTGLIDDPIIEVRMCEVDHKSGGTTKTRVSSLHVRTRSGRTMMVGQETSACQVHGHGGAKRLAGFYGRAGDEVDALGTIWANH
ncbi:jacalin-like lectin [Sorangium sp. So ce260]|uniref:jacalin-like lectin n=1 Tax=Sorangium sp. So ce260 TaxID=3133291 RepID=UPI003F6152D1